MSQAGILDVLSSYPTIPTMFETNSGTAIPILNTLEILGNHVAASASPVATTGALNVVTINVQASSAQASSSALNMGLASFNSSEFSVDANGYVSLSGSSALTFQADSGSATPVANVITFTGSSTGLTTTGAGSTMGLTGTLLVDHGGTSSSSFNINGVVISNTTTTGALSALTLTNGQVVIGSTGLPPVAANLTAGSGISIVNGAGSITISATTGSFTWNDISGAFSPLKENGYFITGTATGTLPALPSQGDTIQFFVDHATQLLTIQASGTQIIRFATQVSSAGGTAVSTQQGDSVELVYRASDTCWCAVDFNGGWNFT